MGESTERSSNSGWVRRGVWSVVVGLSCVFAARPATAQHCQPPTEPDDSLFTATLHGEAAHFESGSMRGFYEGLAVGAAVHRGVLGARANLPYYRLLGPDGAANGWGDLSARLELSLYDDERWSTGPAFAASFPTGDASKRLGMGHVMLGPSAWVLRRAPRFFVGGELGYNQALTGEDDGGTAGAADAHHHHHAASVEDGSTGGPIPNPMNGEELWLGLRASYDLLPHLSLTLGGIGAVPTSEEGAARVTVMAGTEFPMGAARTGVGIEVDLAGETRREVLVATVGVLF